MFFSFDRARAKDFAWGGAFLGGCIGVEGRQKLPGTVARVLLTRCDVCRAMRSWLGFDVLLLMVRFAAVLADSLLTLLPLL